MVVKPTVVVVGNDKFFTMFTAHEDAQYFDDIQFVPNVMGLQEVVVSADSPTCYLFSVRVEDDLADQGHELTVADVFSQVPSPEDGVYGLVIRDTGEKSDRLAEAAGLPVLLPDPQRTVADLIYDACGLPMPSSQKAAPAPKKAAPNFGPKKVAPKPAKPAAPVSLPELPEEKPAPKPVAPVAEPVKPKMDAPAPPLALPELKKDPKPAPVVPDVAPGEKSSPKPKAATGIEVAPRDPRPAPPRDIVRHSPRGGWGSHKTALVQDAKVRKAPEGGSEHWNRSRREMRGVAGRGRRALGIVVAVGVRKGGVGKTTLSVNLAEFMGQHIAEGRSVCLVDMNSQQGDVSHYLKQSEPNIFRLVSQSHLLDDREAFRDVLVTSPTGNFDALLAPKNSLESGPDKVNAHLYSQAIDMLTDMYDVVVVDTPVGERWHAGMEFILKRADFILVPVSPSRSTVQGVHEWLKEITRPEGTEEGLGIRSSQIGVVLNRARNNIGMNADEVRDILTGFQVMAAIPDSPDWQRADNEGRILAENLPEGLSALLSAISYQATNIPSFSEVGKRASYSRAAAPSRRASSTKSGGLAGMLKGWFQMG